MSWSTAEQCLFEQLRSTRPSVQRVAYGTYARIDASGVLAS